MPTRNLAAWEAFQLGRQRMARRTADTLADAEQFFQRAIDLDPRFALAYAGLSDSLTLQIEHAGAPPEATLARADAAVGTALELDPNLAEAWAASALIRSFRNQYDRADPLYRRAIALNPNYAAAYQRFSRNTGGLGHRDEALAAAEKAVELDPLSAIVNADVGRALVAVGRFDEATHRFRRANEIDRCSSGGRPAEVLRQTQIRLPLVRPATLEGGAAPHFDSAAAQAAGLRLPPRLPRPRAAEHIRVVAAPQRLTAAGERRRAARDAVKQDAKAYPALLVHGTDIVDGAAAQAAGLTTARWPRPRPRPLRGGARSRRSGVRRPRAGRRRNRSRTPSGCWQATDHVAWHLFAGTLEALRER